MLFYSDNEYSYLLYLDIRHTHFLWLSNGLSDEKCTWTALVSELVLALRKTDLVTGDCTLRSLKMPHYWLGETFGVYNNRHQKTWLPKSAKYVYA